MPVVPVSGFYFERIVAVERKPGDGFRLVPIVHLPLCLGLPDGSISECSVGLCPFVRMAFKDGILGDGRVAVGIDLYIE